MAKINLPHDWEDPDVLVDLLELTRENRPGTQSAQIRLAYFVAESAHKGQFRRSGEPYITHPVAVAHILLDLHVDDETICAALMHDVLEDCPEVSPDDIRDNFGEDVLRLVEGVTKLSFKNMGESDPRKLLAAETTRTAESLRKMLLAMANDVRVMIIKLADRLHNLRTLDSLSPEKRTRIANETLDIYAPLAGRLGIWQIKWQLEDLSFKHLHPKEFQNVTDLVSKSRGDREKELNEAIIVLKEALTKKGLRGVEVSGRPKHLYSIFNKMVKHGFDFEDILDLIAMRVIVQENHECYMALGIVHELWVPVAGLFSDYIAKPKPNGYQSLHTKVIGPSGEPVEIQIRTRAMHEIAEYGVAAHLTYKEGGASDTAHRLFSLRQQLFDWSSDSRTSSDFLRSLSTDLFTEQVFVFTPKGDVLDLPKNSTPIDFAFRVHSAMGLQLAGAKVNGQIVPLGHVLSNGDVVEITTRSNATPSLDWIEIARSSHARNKIRGYFRRRDKQINVSRGRDLLEKELKSLRLDPRDYLGEEKLDHAAESMGIESAHELLAKVGEGLRSVQSVVTKLRGTVQELPKVDVIQTSKTKEGKVALYTAGLEHVLLRRARCCDPIPGDDVVGYVTRGRGMMIHRRVCPNAMNLQANEPDRLMPLEWPSDGSLHPVVVKIITINRQGLLMDISTIFGEAKVNVSAAKIRTLPNQTAEIEVTIEVGDTVQLTQVMNKIGNFSDVISILRMFGRSASR